MFFVSMAFLTPFFNAIANIIEGRLINDVFKKTTTMVFYISLMNFAFLPLILFLGMPTIPSYKVLSLMALLGVIEIAYLFPYYKALKKIDISIVVALFSLGRITIPVMSYFFLGEKLLIAQYVGFFIIIISSIALSIEDFKFPKLNKAFYYMIVASTLLSIYIVLEKHILNQGENWINVVIYPKIISGIIPFMFLFSKHMRNDIFISAKSYIKNIKFLGINEFVCFLAITAEIYALSGLSPVITTSINATAPIFTLLITLLLYKIYKLSGSEDIDKKTLKKKFICFAFIITGVVLAIH